MLKTTMFDRRNEPWSRSEKTIARRAYDQAYSRELTVLTDDVRRLANQITEPHHIWALHDFLTRKRKEIDQKFDYRYSQLNWVFARPIREGWLSEDEIAGLADEKLARIRAALEL